MGCQGEIYTIYGVNVDATVAHEPGPDRNPVIYDVNGHRICSDDMDLPPKANIKFYNGVPTEYYGATDLSKKGKLVIRALGHSARYGHGDMGSRHFKDQALVGYVVCCESYINSAAPLPPMKDIEALGPKLVADIKDKLKLDIKTEDLGLHLLFDAMNGL